MTEPFDFDPFSPREVADPYPAYARLHEGPRAVYLERSDIWVLSRYDDVRTGLRDHARLSSSDGITYIRAPLPMMLTVDPPDHERLRRIAGREFAPRDIHRFRPLIERFVTDGFEELERGDTDDLMQAIAMPVPIRIMAHILGVPEADLPELRRMSDDLVQGFSIAPDTGSAIIAENGGIPADFMRITKAIAYIHTYFGALIEQRHNAPTDDMITKLMLPAAEGSLTDGELLWFCLLLLVAGIETTTNLIANMTIALIHDRQAWFALKEDRSLVGSTVNETLRFDAPIQGFFRSARTTYPVGDIEIPKDARVLLSFGAANRDPTHYSQPDTFQVARDPADHLGFGAGIHRCLGAGLAELEGRIVLEQLLERASSVEPAGEIVRTSNPTLRGAARLPVALMPERTLGTA